MQLLLGGLALPNKAQMVGPEVPGHQTMLAVVVVEPVWQEVLHQAHRPPVPAATAWLHPLVVLL
jgi:hypothetical protein